MVAPATSARTASSLTYATLRARRAALEVEFRGLSEERGALYVIAPYMCTELEWGAGVAEVMEGISERTMDLSIWGAEDGCMRLERALRACHGPTSGGAPEPSTSRPARGGNVTARQAP